ncbi:type I secretion system permease/ATPase [Legionella waltersii]|uniref:Toxin secretion ATP binding protein n=1 Tax=Legionella waltersii TaxID=66969 RepID=A0A0W1ALR8_9GAMM|nr:type I secretion system permease/ATPase [Legionella waltersii]KTD82265.1 toxin secretion ATP binding protein [Legionella waltersii]SNV04399.1 toxin secretion ATP binding protein [Legionella waltersii]
MNQHDKNANLYTYLYHSCQHALLYIGLFSLFINLFMLTIPVYMMQIFDRVLAARNYQTLIFLTLIAAFILLILSILDMVRIRIAGRISNWLDERLSPAALLSGPDCILNGNNYPQLVLKDIAQLKSILSGSFLFTLMDTPWVPIYLLVIVLISPLLGVVATVGAILLFAIAIMNQRLTHKIQTKIDNSSMMNTFNTSNTLRHAEVIQAMGMLGHLINGWQEKNKKSLELTEELNKLSSVIISSSKFARMLLQVLILAVGAYLVLNNQITGGMMIAASILMSRALSPVDQAIGAWKQFQHGKEIMERLKAHFENSSQRNTSIKLPKPKGLLSVEGLCLSSSSAEPRMILEDIHFKVKPGEILALLGPSAAGKTTLARLICGIVKPTSGSVRLDGADVYHWDRNDFGHYVGYLPQDIELFSASIKDNIARLGPVDELAVIKAAQLAGCHDMILHLPNGYESLIQSSISQLSGGQRQRVALARALYGDPQLIVLDEPNSNLDAEGEFALLNALLKLKEQKCTIVVISHRPNLIQYADNIVLLSDGKIKMAGTKEKVLAKLQLIKTEHQQRSSYGMG